MGGLAAQPSAGAPSGAARQGREQGTPQPLLHSGEGEELSTVQSPGMGAIARTKAQAPGVGVAPGGRGASRDRVQAAHQPLCCALKGASGKRKKVIHILTASSLAQNEADKKQSGPRSANSSGLLLGGWLLPVTDPQQATGSGRRQRGRGQISFFCHFFCTRGPIQFGVGGRRAQLLSALLEWPGGEH